MIVSASYRTDIPAFYGRWFLNRFRAGWAKAVNPYGRQISTIPLRSGVDGFVFWTRNPGPFRDALDEIRRAGLPFVLQVTLTGYPRALESSVIEVERSLALMSDLARAHGPRVVAWRYDPILATSATPLDWHEDNFARLAARLEGITDEVSVSFATLYRKTERNLAAAARAHHFGWSDPAPEDKRGLLRSLAERAAGHGIRLTLCSQPDLLTAGIEPSSCVDARRLEDVAKNWGLDRRIAAKVKGNRPGCLCHESRDIGEYDTCPHGCTYCYAVGSRTLAKRRFAEHDPDSEFLLPPPWLDAVEKPQTLL
ncbi:DUF1848 domain-containing protein [Paramagnetospirillum magneticum]|uniref:DNA repair photolyase n=1 Tax=Paramagnetospirillum magneticum (strain ATCC 700264 / AMB-1) TaxID=342108 RepID=Q2VYX2_PARM1|nr:DUF1848 domain-containing protein [Paramagnetospirillum magneticum]BAE53203.1 hypothetical protein amb4399 [Paramagnetospirillum magneticum AMB-1]